MVGRGAEVGFVGRGAEFGVVGRGAEFGVVGRRPAACGDGDTLRCRVGCC